MKKKEIYLVSFRTGSFDDTVFISIFATFEKEVAQKYKEKFNRIVLEAKKHYLTNKGELKKKYHNTFIEDAYWNYYDVYSDPHCYYEKIEIR